MRSKNQPPSHTRCRRLEQPGHNGYILIFMGFALLAVCCTADGEGIWAEERLMEEGQLRGYGWGKYMDF